MFRIKRFSHFRINEVDTSDTYLDKSKNIKVDPTLRKEPTEIFKMKGKIFKDAPKTSGKSYGLKFTKEGAGYNVVFPDNFFEHFLSDSKPIELDYTEEEYDFNKNQFISKKYRSSVAELLKDRVYIQTEKKYNRIHFSGGIPEQLQQIGLGYVIYEEFIKFLGVASSDRSSSSPDAKTVWQKVSQDPDFYCIITENKNANSRILAVYKDHPINSNSQKNKLGLIIEDFLRNETIQQQGQGAILKVDDYLIEKYPNLKIWQEHFKQGFTKQDWQNEITEVVNKLVELKDKKSLSGNVFQSINTKMYWFESFYSINKITEQEIKVYTQLYNKLLDNCFQKKPGQSSNEFSRQNYEPLSFTITHEMASERVVRALNFILVIQPLTNSNKEQVSPNQEIQLFPLV